MRLQEVQAEEQGQEVLKPTAQRQRVFWAVKSIKPVFSSNCSFLLEAGRFPLQCPAFGGQLMP